MTQTLPIRFDATVVDELNVQAICSAYVLVDPTASFNDVLTTLNVWLADLDACTDGQIIKVEMEVDPALPGGLKSAAVAGSRVELTGDLSFTATGSSHKWLALVPALANNTDVISGGKPVLTGGEPLNTLYSLLIGGGTSSLIWTNANQQALSGFSGGFLGTRAYNRQLSKLSYERA